MSLFTRLLSDLTSGRRETAFPGELIPDELGIAYVGADLSVPTLIEAYIRGCYPYTGSEPIPWFSPDPRLVLFPNDFRASRRLRRLSRQNRFTVQFDTDFPEVMRGCASIPRKDQPGTWITDNMITAYAELFNLKIAHCVSVYTAEGTLCGGLYGLTFGRAFFGESMFSAVPNTSKLALYALCRRLSAWRFDLIDCQEVTAHLMRLGAVPLTRREYLAQLHLTLQYPSRHISWADPPIDPFTQPHGRTP